MLREILTLDIFSFFVVFARVGTAIMLLPGIGAIYVSPRIRLSFALGVTFVAILMVGDRIPAPPASPAELALLIVGEVVIGAFLGTVARIMIAALQTAGTLVALFASLSNAFVQDPIAEQQSSTVSGFLATVGLTLIFVTGLDHVMLRAIVDSYSLFEPGRPVPYGDLNDAVARQVASSFALGLQLSAPFLILAMTYYIGLGLLGRLMPQLQVFFFGLPVQIAMQIWLMMVALSGMMLVFMTRFRDGFTGLLAQ